MRMFRCVRSTWMMPSKAKLALSIRFGARRGRVLIRLPRARAPPSRGRARSRADAGGRARAASASRRRRPGGRGHVTERARNPFGNLVAPVDREREHVGRLVDPEVVALEVADLFLVDERDPELAVLDAFRGEQAPRELDGSGLVDLHPAPVVDLDRDCHLCRAVPVSSACCLYASTMRWTSLWRTTSRWLKWTNAIPSIALRISCT